MVHRVGPATADRRGRQHRGRHSAHDETRSGFRSLAFLRPAADGRLAVVDSVDYRIKLVDEAGTVADVLERPVRPIPVTDAIRDAEREWRLDQLDGPGYA